jgi:hypothetical protein
MNATASITVTPVRVADLLAEGERMPDYVRGFVIVGKRREFANGRNEETDEVVLRLDAMIQLPSAARALRNDP